MARKITPTHVLLNQIELSSSASSVTFSNIPQGYGDLVLIVSGGTSGASTTSVEIQFNGDTSTSNYPMVCMQGGGDVGTYASFTVSRTFMAVGSTSYTGIVHVMDYSATDKHKTILLRDNSPVQSDVRATAGRWSNTAAVTSIQLYDNSGETLDSGNVFSLYGVYA